MNILALIMVMVMVMVKIRIIPMISDLRAVPMGTTTHLTALEEPLLTPSFRCSQQHYPHHHYPHYHCHINHPNHHHHCYLFFSIVYIMIISSNCDYVKLQFIAVGQITQVRWGRPH